MPNESLLIDHQGKIWPADSFLLRAQNYGFVAGSAFHEYSLRNLGFVEVRRHGQAAEIRLRLRAVSEVAFAALVYYITDKAPRRIALTLWHEGEWHTEIEAGPLRAVERLAELLKTAQPYEKGRVNLREYNVWSRPGGRAFRQIAEAWKVAGAQSTLDDLMQMTTPLAENRFMVFEYDPAAGFHVSAFGDNQPGYALNWLQGGARRYMHLQPDRDYAWSCEQSYSRALRRAVPVCEEVDAVVYWGGAPNRVPMRRQYRRLLLPLRYNGRRHVMSVTCEDASIDLGSRANVLA